MIYKLIVSSKYHSDHLDQFGKNRFIPTFGTSRVNIISLYKEIKFKKSLRMHAILLP